jgi:hypothetical protein
MGIDFEALLPVVRRLEELRGRAGHAAERLDLERRFKEITHGRQIPPRPFKSDGCTYSTDRFGKDCCVLHDASYWLSGTREDRRAADLALWECTRQKSRLYATIQYYGVRIFGHPITGHPVFMGLFKKSFWGFGYEYGESPVKY